MTAPRVIVRLKGGPGNRLFQAATGRTLALAAGWDLLLDTSAYREDRLRAFQLDHFSIAARPLRRCDGPFFRLQRSRLGTILPGRFRLDKVRESFPARVPVWPVPGGAAARIGRPAAFSFQRPPIPRCD